jgi:hypothetical protein
VEQQRIEWSGIAQKLQPFLSSAGLTQQQLLWALSVTRSRAFAAPYAAAPLSTAPKALAAASVLAAAAWLAAGTAAAVGVEVLGAAAAAGVWFALQQQLQTQQQHAICPLLDFFNHDGREQVGKWNLPLLLLQLQLYECSVNAVVPPVERLVVVVTLTFRLQLCSLP